MDRPIHGGNLAWAAWLADCPASHLLDFSASINPFGPPEGVFCAITESLTTLGNYPDPHYPKLRQSLGQHHGLSPEWILPGNGSAELLTWAGYDLSHCSLTYLVTPAFSDYGRVLKTFNVETKLMPLEVEHPQLAWASSWGGRSSIRAGLLLNNPHNPTGIVFSRQELRPLLAQFGLVVVDEAFMDFLPESEQPSLVADIADYPNLVILRSLTKFFRLPGLRLGYAIAHPERLQRWQQWRDPWPVNTLAAVAGRAALQDADFQLTTREWLPQARSELMAGLEALPPFQPLPSATNFVLVRTEIPGSQLQKALLTRAQILIRDCLSFPELGDRYFRVAVRTREDNQRLLSAVEHVCADPSLWQ